VSGSPGGVGSAGACVDVSCVRESREVRSSGGEELSGAVLDGLKRAWMDSTSFQVPWAPDPWPLVLMVSTRLPFHRLSSSEVV
jgi:hypothetical protein